MSRLGLVVLLTLAVACHDEIVVPVGTIPPASRAIQPASPSEGPPPPHPFGWDLYSIGRFTGQGTTQPGLNCQQLADGVRECTGFLASAVDGTRLDVTLTLPSSTTKTPLVALICRDRRRARECARGADRILSACQAYAGEYPFDWDYPGRRRIVFVAERDVHEGLLCGYGVLDLPPEARVAAGNGDPAAAEPDTVIRAIPTGTPVS